MMEVQGHQHLFEQCQRCAGKHVVLAEALQRETTDLQLSLELGHRIGAVVPQIGQGLRRTGRPRIMVGEEDLSRRQGFFYQSIQLLCFLGGGWKLRIGVANGEAIPASDPDSVGVAEIE